MNSITSSNKKTKTSLHFIALIPDKEVRFKGNAIKKDFARFGSSKATEVYTHITLINPFKCLEEDRMEILSWFTEMYLPQKPFHLYLDGFKAFANKEHPVIYINPAPSRELISLQRELSIGFNKIFSANVHSREKSFKPHMTVAYRDLTPENFYRAWDEYKHKPFYDVFDVHSIYLLEHNWKKWNIIATHKLG